jgi:hypothetical protein
MPYIIHIPGHHDGHDIIASKPHALSLDCAVGWPFVPSGSAGAQNMPMGLAPGAPSPPLPRDAAPPRDANDPGYVLEEYPDKLPKTSNQCVFFRTLYDWRPLNNTSLIVWAPSRSHPYHIQLDKPCFGLRFAHSIGFTSRDSRLCGFGGDAVLVESGGGRPDRCPIGSITELTEDSLKSLLAQAPGRSSQDKKAEDSEPKD